MSRAGVRPIEWRWRPTQVRSPQLVGSSLSAASVAGHLHVLVSRPDAGGVSHSRLDGGSLVELPDVGLRSISGSIDAGAENALLVCGARVGKDLPAVCRVDAAGETTKTTDLPRASPVAAWPRLVSIGAERYAVWASGGLLDASVWLSAVGPGGLSEPVCLLEGAGTMSFHVSATRSAVDVLCYGDRLDFVRWGQRQLAIEVKRTLQTDNDAAAGLLDGVVFWPKAAHSFSIWDARSDEQRTLELPEPPERASSRSRHLRLVSSEGQPDLVYWETHLPDDFRVRLGDDGSRIVHGSIIRAWLAPLDRVGWQVGLVSELPGSSSPPLLAWVEGGLAVARAVSGTIEVTLGEPLVDQP